MTPRLDVRPEEITDPQTGREHGICARCGYARCTHAHHRKTRARGGPDSWANLVGLCAQCHDWVHGHDTESELDGWLIPSWVPDERIPAIPVRYAPWFSVRVTFGDGSSINPAIP